VAEPWSVDPSKPLEDESIERAAKTRDPAGKWWEAGGGGTAWNSSAAGPGAFLAATLTASIEHSIYLIERMIDQFENVIEL
jgi:hypothetical protein